MVLQGRKRGQCFSHVPHRPHVPGGLGLGQDDEAAAGWFLEAAEKGHAEAQRRIGLMYRDGLGVERSISEAGKWLGRAADQGDADAKKELELLGSEG